jgi:hypothetical protein
LNRLVAPGEFRLVKGMEQLLTEIRDRLKNRV